MRTLLLLMASLSLCFHLSAQDSTLVKQLEQHIYHITTQENGQLKGQGLSFLIDEAKASMFILLGERRFTEEIPKVTSNLFSALAAEGYNAIGIETGPLAAKKLQSLAGNSEPQSFQDFFSQFPNSIPYYDHREESDFIRSAVQNGASLWGLDQVANTSLRPFFHKLVKLSKNRTQRTLAEAYLKKAIVGYDNDSLLMMNGLISSDFEDLKETFKKNSKAGSMITKLEESKAIYSLFQNRQYYESNLMRNNLMKKYLTKFINRPESGKMLIKVGALMAGRGKNQIGFYSIGNLASEHAESHNSKSIHILVTGKAYLRDGKSKGLSEIDPELAILEQISSPDHITLFDLRPLRESIFMGKIRNIAPDLVEVIHAYDIVMILPKLTHALVKYD